MGSVAVLEQSPSLGPAARSRRGTLRGPWVGILPFALYVLLFLVPLTAITGAWLEGHPLTWLGGDVSPWLAASHDLGAQLAKIHGWLGDAILWVAGLHALAALYHHFVLKDGVLRSMVPGR